jgi:hypothetical protein
MTTQCHADFFLLLIQRMVPNGQHEALTKYQTGISLLL